MDKQLNLLYFSATDRTATVVKEIGKNFGSEFKEYNITMPSDREKGLVFGSEDLLIVGVPVFGGRVPAFLGEYFSKVKGNRTPAVFTVVYGNRDYEDALLELKNIFEENGFIGIGAAAFIGEHSYTEKIGTGRPDKSDLEIAKEFGAKVLDKLNSSEGKLQETKLVVKGNFPYKERKSALGAMAPETNDDCIDCGICAKYCPKEAISFNNFKEIDASKCIKCCSCIKRCVVGAKYFNDETFKQFTQRLIDNFSSIRREPELFIAE